jgi:hypothetical protein
MAAGGAQRCGSLGVNQPVAGLMPGIVAEAQRALGRRQRTPVIAIRPKRGNSHGRRQKSQPIATLFATGVFKIQHLPAILALEQLHPW